MTVELWFFQNFLIDLTPRHGDWASETHNQHQSVCHHDLSLPQVKTLKLIGSYLNHALKMQSSMLFFSIMRSISYTD